MSTALTAYSGVGDPLVFIEKMGTAIAKSGMFGCESESQGQIFAMSCLAQKCDPFTLPQTWHVMGKKLVMRSDAALGRLSCAGGTYEIVEHQPDACEIIVEFKGRKFRERLTWDEAKQEPFVYDGSDKDNIAHLAAGRTDKLKLHTNYATPRRRMQQLWARVVSDAVRVVAPEIITGMYTPEEVSDFTGIDLRGRSIDFSADAVEAVAEREAIQLADTSMDGEPVDASFTIVGGEVVTVSGDLQLEASPQALQSTPAPAPTPAKPVEDIPKIFQRNMAEKIDKAEELALKKFVADMNITVPGIADEVRKCFVAQGLKFADLSWKSAEDLRRKLEVRELNAMAGLMLTRGS